MKVLHHLPLWFFGTFDIMWSCTIFHFFKGIWKMLLKEWKLGNSMFNFKSSYSASKLLMFWLHLGHNWALNWYTWFLAFLAISREKWVIFSRISREIKNARNVHVYYSANQKKKAGQYVKTYCYVCKSIEWVQMVKKLCKKNWLHIGFVFR